MQGPASGSGQTSDCCHNTATRTASACGLFSSCSIVSAGGAGGAGGDTAYGGPGGRGGGTANGGGPGGRGGGTGRNTGMPGIPGTAPMGGAGALGIATGGGRGCTVGCGRGGAGRGTAWVACAALCIAACAAAALCIDAAASAGVGAKGLLDTPCRHECPVQQKTKTPAHRWRCRGLVMQATACGNRVAGVRHRPCNRRTRPTGIAGPASLLVQAPKQPSGSVKDHCDCVGVYWAASFVPVQQLCGASNTTNGVRFVCKSVRCMCSMLFDTCVPCFFITRRRILSSGLHCSGKAHGRR